LLLLLRRTISLAATAAAAAAATLDALNVGEHVLPLAQLVIVLPRRKEANKTFSTGTDYRLIYRYIANLVNWLGYQNTKILAVPNMIFNSRKLVFFLIEINTGTGFLQLTLNLSL
jgi:hypothetical protein